MNTKSLATKEAVCATAFSKLQDRLGFGSDSQVRCREDPRLGHRMHSGNGDRCWELSQMTLLGQAGGHG